MAKTDFVPDFLAPIRAGGAGRSRPGDSAMGRGPLLLHLTGVDDKPRKRLDLIAPHREPVRRMDPWTRPTWVPFGRERMDISSGREGTGTASPRSGRSLPARGCG